MVKGNIVILNKKPSEELQELVKSFAYTTLQRAEIVEKIITKANEEGIESQQIGEMIKDVLRKQGVSESTIARSIPDNFKNKKMQQIRSKRKPKERVHYIKNEEIKLPDMPPNSTVFIGELDPHPIVNLPPRLYAKLKTQLLTAMANKYPKIEFELKDNEIIEIL